MATITQDFVGHLNDLIAEIDDSHPAVDYYEPDPLYGETYWVLTDGTKVKIKVEVEKFDDQD